MNEHGRELGEGQVDDGDGRGCREYEDARARLVAACVGVRAEPEAQQEFLRLQETWRANEHRLLRHFRYQDL